MSPTVLLFLGGNLQNMSTYFTLTEVFLTLAEVFLTLAEVFSCFFLSCKANARVYLAKTGHDSRSY